MDLLSNLRTKAQQTHRAKNIKIGIGLKNNAKAVRASIDEATNLQLAEATFYEDAEVMLQDLAAAKIDGAVRGSLPANDTLQILKSIFQLEYLLRLACVKVPSKSDYVFMAPVGIDEGSTTEQKLDFIIKGSEFVKKLGIVPKIGLVAGGHPEDKGRSVRIDESLETGDKICELSKAQNIQVNNYGISIEEAVNACNFILLPDGVAGNLVFRALYYLSGAESIGAPVINLNKVFIDTSRTKRSYVEAIAFAGALVD